MVAEVGVEPTRPTGQGILSPLHKNHKHLKQQELSESAIPDFAISLARILQKYPEIKQIITAWPKLPEHIKAAIRALIQTHELEKK